MAQRSKKDQIIQAALPLFLANGFKGTSIDMVVRQSSVSKPTVYNHFPNKAALLLAVIEQWIVAKKPSLPVKLDNQGFDSLVQTKWLNPDTVRLYALVIGEGWRFPQAKKLFWEQFDSIWRKALAYVSEQSPGIDQNSIEPVLDQQLMLRLKQLP